VRALLDINVLLALLDAGHVDHQKARDWILAEICWLSPPGMGEDS
jgi:uncharacterized protein